MTLPRRSATWTLRGVLAGALAAAIAAGVIACSTVEPDKPSQAAPIPEITGQPQDGAVTGPLRVSDNRRFLANADGSPFFWLGDTAWSMLNLLDRAETVKYLDTRAKQGFNVVQATAGVAAGPNTGNRQGDFPYRGSLDQLAVTPGADPADNQQYDYWDHIDWVVEHAHARGIRIALLPVWAGSQVGRVVTTSNAQGFGEFVGKRYGNRVVYVFGGDTSADGVEDVWRALAKGIAIGATGSEDYSTTIMTYHPLGDQSSAKWFHDDPWLDFNMIQGGHCLRYGSRSNLVTASYADQPAKPFLDGEPIYEDHPYCWDQPPEGYSTALDVRKDAYWSVFGGAAGHTYGHHTVWQFLQEGRVPHLGAFGTWSEALSAQAGGQMRYLRALMQSRPFQSGVPDTSVVASGAGSGRDRIQATRGADGSYLMVYVPNGREMTVKLTALSGDGARIWWFNPRTGEATGSGTVPLGDAVRLTPPSSGSDGNDWVLVADSAARNFGPPGGAQ